MEQLLKSLLYVKDVLDTSNKIMIQKAIFLMTSENILYKTVVCSMCRL